MAYDGIDPYHGDCPFCAGELTQMQCDSHLFLHDRVPTNWVTVRIE